MTDLTSLEDEEPEGRDEGLSGERDLSLAIEDYRTMQDIVFTTLREEILAGRLRPGERLNSIRLARRLGVSRMPVREALGRLASAGLVEYVPHRGAFVKKLSIEEVIEIYYIRAALEGVAARLAARNLSRSEIARLVKLCGEMERRLTGGNDAEILDINQEFHCMIYRAAHSPRLEELIMQYYQHSSQYRTLGLDLPGRYDEILAEHRNIARALAARDPECAEVAAREHHLNTARRIARSVGSRLEI